MNIKFLVLKPAAILNHILRADFVRRIFFRYTTEICKFYCILKKIWYNYTIKAVC